MVDIAIEVVRSTVTRDDPTRTLHRGDITMVRRALQTHVDNPRSTAPNKSQIIITGVPLAAARKMERLLLAPQYDPADSELVGDEYVPTKRRRVITAFRDWHIPPAAVPAGLRQDLLNPPYAIKVTWTQVRNRYIRRKRDGVLLDE